MKNMSTHLCRTSRISRRVLLSLVVLVAALGANTAVAQSITTMFAANNAFAGNTFDLEVLSPVPLMVTGFDVNLDTPGSTNTIAVYYRLGTSDGFTNDPTGWILLGKDTNVISAGIDTPSNANIGGLVLVPGQVYGIYLDLESYVPGGTALLYTNAAAPTEFNDGSIKLTTFYGRSNVAFSGTDFIHRIWNGTVYYNPTEYIPVPVLDNWKPLTILILLLGIAGLLHQRFGRRISN